MTSINSTAPEDADKIPANSPAAEPVLDSTSDISQPIATPTSPTAKRRHKSIRTAIRQLLTRSTSEAIGQLGDTEDGSNKRVVGTSTMAIETGTKPGQTPATKHVHVSVIMSVSDDPACACACPIPPVVVMPPLPPVAPRPNKWWWVVAPILAIGPWSGNPSFKDPAGTVVTAKPPTLTGTPAKGTTGTPSVSPVVAPVPTPAPVVPNKPVDTTTSGDQSGSPAGQGGKTSNPGSGIPTVSGSLPTGLGSPIPYCSNITGEFRTEPGYAKTHSPGWVKTYANTWFVKRQAQCGVTVQAIDLCGRLLDTQTYGADAGYLGQTLYSRKGKQLQIDQLDAHDQLISRTTYINADTQNARITMTYRFDAQLHRLFEARMTRNLDGSMLNVVLWTFGADGQVAAHNVYVDVDQITVNVSHHFDQFSDFRSGSW